MTLRVGRRYQDEAVGDGKGVEWKVGRLNEARRIGRLV